MKKAFEHYDIFFFRKLSKIRTGKRKISIIIKEKIFNVGYPYLKKLKSNQKFMILIYRI